MKLKKNDLVVSEIVDITNLGFGVAKIDGAVVFVSGTVPGDIAKIRIIKVGSSYSVGRVEELIKSSDLRTEGRCNNTACRSCAYKCLSYSHEMNLKEESVRQIFKKSGLDEVKIMPIVGSPCEKEYRNKAQYPVSCDKDGRYVIGFYAPKSHRVTEAADCPLAPEIFGRIIESIRTFLAENGISVYDEQSGEGLIRHIYLRRGEISGEVLLTLVINGDTLPHSDRLVARLNESFPELVGILLNINKENTNIILGERFLTLYGRDYIFDTLGNVALKITAPSFYQVNHDAAELLYAKAKELANPTKDDLVLDLYCGAGSIGLSMADMAGEVIGVEIVESAVECAKFNAEINHIFNASFYAGDASDTKKILEPAERIRGEKIKPDIVIFDPPRGGTTEELIEHITSLSPRKIVYISCNPATLARDMVILKKFGYEGNEVTPFDLFPMTGHVESVVCLTRRLDN
ncbi:MAG: 23S rRNA (uracil(1939)-C(5))-methyltransferase RlmD [Clostridia bacterium]|nr:23S rRNA (uracil(1939)-C(5))-methyltransferase RlmD [Clostridia bacterium]